MGDGEGSISIKPGRVSRLRDATNLAAGGEFEEAAALLHDLPQDGFAEAERVVRDLILDYKVAVAQSALAIEEFRQSKQELLQKLETIEQQQASIQKLSAPLIDVWERVIAVPLIGAFDDPRARDLSERLLNRIQQTATAWVILDLTGIEVVDARIAEHLLRLASAVRLMGASCLLTGMRASVAQLLTSLGSSIESIRSLPSLREGLKYCLSRSS